MKFERISLSSFFALMFLLRATCWSVRRTHGFLSLSPSSRRYLGEHTLVSTRLEPKLFHTTFSSSPRLFSSYSLLDGLNDAQVEAVTQPLSSITRVVAGPGAGKTRVLTCRIAHLLQQDPASQVLAVTFTKKAAEEMQHRLHKILASVADTMQTSGVVDVLSEEDRNKQMILEKSVDGRPNAGSDRVTLGTFHSICAKILRWNGKKLNSLPTIQEEMMGAINATNLDGNFAIVDQSEQLRILNDVLKEKHIDLRAYKDLKIESILTAIGKIKAMRAVKTEITNADKEKPLYQVAFKVYPRYRERLFSNNAMDFDDLILFTRELLSTHDDLREGLRRRWRHVLVDEFQDTSTVQLDLVRLLTSESLLVVGDADQSIYSWRGAAVESMSDFEKEFNPYHAGGVKTVYLMENYRSTGNIVNAAQKIISQEASPTNTMRQNMKPMRGKGNSPRIWACEDGRAEANFVVETIQSMIHSGEYTPDRTIAIIYRTNFQSRALEEACVKHNLSYLVRGSAGTFYNRQEIKDCLCFMRWIYNGRDQGSMIRAIKVGGRGIGEKALEAFVAYCSSVDAFYMATYPELPRPSPLDVLFSFTDETVGGRHSGVMKDAPPFSGVIKKAFLTKFMKFSGQMREIEESAYEDSVSDMINTILDIMELKEHINSISKTDKDFSDRWGNVQELRYAAERHTDQGSALKRQVVESDEDVVALQPLGSFLDDVALVADIGAESDNNVEGNDSEGKPKVLRANLMTIHASKGMEFDAVFLVGNEDGTLPSHRAINEGNGSVALDEERRLCYVAMTRAKNDLIMTWRRKVSTFCRAGNLLTHDMGRSRFLNLLVGVPRKSTSSDMHENVPPFDRPSSLGSNTWKKAIPSTSSMYLRTRPPGARDMTTFTSGVDVSQKDFPTTGLPVRPTSATEPKRTSVVKAYLPTKVPPFTKSPTLNTRSISNAAAPLPQPIKQNQSPHMARANMDSTWFYPVGSTVRHKILGVGKVLPPPPLEKGGEMLVHVKFRDGREELYSAMGADLIPC